MTALDRPSSPRSRVASAALRLACALIFLAGCAKPAGVLFPPLPKPLVWPEPPEEPRIAYVGQLATSGDLKPARSAFEGLGQALFGKKEEAAMLSPFGVCTDAAGEKLFVADTSAQMVHVFDLKRRKYARLQPPRPLLMTQPVAVAFDPARNRVLAADSVGGALFAYDAATGAYQGLLGEGLLERPAGVTVDPASGNIVVSDAHAHRLVVLTGDGQLVARVGQRGSAPGSFNFPTHVTFDRQGRLYVADSLNFRVQQFAARSAAPAVPAAPATAEADADADADADAPYVLTRVIGQHGDVPGTFSQPKGVAADSHGHVYVVDSRFENVQIFDPVGRLLLYFGTEGTGPGQFWLPAGIHIDAKDRLYVADPYNRRVQVFDYLHRPDGAAPPPTPTTGPLTVPVAPVPERFGYDAAQGGGPATTRSAGDGAGGDADVHYPGAGVRSIRIAPRTAPAASPAASPATPPATNPAAGPHPSADRPEAQR